MGRAHGRRPAGDVCQVPPDWARPGQPAGLVGHGAAPAAEFNKSHIPAFLAGEDAKNYVSVYPFVRSYEWYLLDDAERRELLASTA